MTERHSNDTALPSIEVMGALCSLLIHDLANHLSVISGNAQFAQFFPDDNKRTGPAIAAIAKAGESAASLLVKCGDLRRGLGSGFHPSDLSDVREMLDGFHRRHPGWAVNCPAPLSGRTALPARWVEVALNELVRETRSETGGIDVAITDALKRYIPGGISPAPGSGRRYLELLLSYDSPEPVAFDEIRSQHTNLALLSACELLKLTGGGTGIATGLKDRQEICICVTLAD